MREACREVEDIMEQGADAYEKANLRDYAALIYWQGRSAGRSSGP